MRVVHSMRAPIMSMRAALSALSAIVSAALLMTTAAAQEGATGIDPQSRAYAREKLAQCLAKTENKAEEAYEDGLIWLSLGGGLEAHHCVAAAQVARGDVELGAKRFESLGGAPDALTQEEGALFYHKAGSAWLLINAAADAEAAFDRGLDLLPDQPDLLIDRARARALRRNWAGAEEDLTRALVRRQGSGLVWRLRAQARLRQDKVEAAAADLERALEIEPDAIDNLVLRGDIAEARRRLAQVQ